MAASPRMWKNVEYFFKHRGSSTNVIGNLDVATSRNSFITRICVVVVTIREDVNYCCRSTERIALEKGSKSDDVDVNPCCGFWQYGKWDPSWKRTFSCSRSRARWDYWKVQGSVDRRSSWQRMFSPPYVLEQRRERCHVVFDTRWVLVSFQPSDLVGRSLQNSLQRVKTRGVDFELD